MFSGLTNLGTGLGLPFFNPFSSSPNRRKRNTISPNAVKLKKSRRAMTMASRRANRKRKPTGQLKKRFRRK